MTGPKRRAYLTVGDAARRCGVSNRTVQNWIQSGKLDASRLPSGQYRIHEDVLQVHLRSRGQPGEQTPSRARADAHGIQACWGRRELVPSHGCFRCAVYAAQALHCFVLRRQLPPGASGCPVPCSDCVYFAEVVGGLCQSLHTELQPCMVVRGGILLGANAPFVEFTGHPLEQLIGAPWTDLIPPLQRETWVRRAREIRPRGLDGVHRTRAVLLHRSGEPMNVEQVACAFPRIQGSVLVTYRPA